MFVSRVTMYVYVCPGKSCCAGIPSVSTPFILKCAHSDHKLYNSLIFASCIASLSYHPKLPGNTPITLTTLLNPLLVIPHFIWLRLYLPSPSPSLLSPRKRCPDAFPRLTIICVLYFQLFHLFSHIYLLKKLVPFTNLLSSFAAGSSNMFISFPLDGQS